MQVGASLDLHRNDVSASFGKISHVSLGLNDH